jgi:hypothetical protein
MGKFSEALLLFRNEFSPFDDGFRKGSLTVTFLLDSCLNPILGNFLSFTA